MLCLQVGGVNPTLALSVGDVAERFWQGDGPSSAGESGRVVGPESCCCTEKAFLKFKFFPFPPIPGTGQLRGWGPCVTRRKPSPGRAIRPLGILFSFRPLLVSPRH